MSKVEEKNKLLTKLPMWVIILTFCIFLAFVYLTLIRYGLISKAIDKGDATTSALLLTPEITMGIATLF